MTVARLKTHKILIAIVVVTLVYVWWKSTWTSDSPQTIEIFIDNVKIEEGYEEADVSWVPIRAIGRALEVAVDWSREGVILDGRSILDFDSRNNTTYVRAQVVSDYFGLRLKKDVANNRVTYLTNLDVDSSATQVMEDEEAKVVVDGVVLTKSAVNVNNRIFASASILELGLVGDFRWSALKRKAYFDNTPVPFIVREGTVLLDVIKAADARHLYHHATRDVVSIDSGAPPIKSLELKAVVDRAGGSADVVILTFDDGLKDSTYDLLDILEAENIPATFFVTGESVVTHPEIAQRVASMGHEILNHTFTHRRLDTLTDDEIVAELVGTRIAIFQALNCVSAVPRVRPPGGRLNSRVEESIGRAGYQVVNWSINSHDWDQTQSPEQIHQTVLNAIHPGAVVLLHNAPPNTLAALPAIIGDLKGLGYGFSTLRDVLDPESAYCKHIQTS